MNLFSISQLAQFSGIKPHTIRIWEQRYNALQPARSEGNTRYYSGNQLRRLLNIVSLMELNYKVSELCSMSDIKLSELVLEKQSAVENETFEYFISQLISAGMNYDEELFDKLFYQCLTRFGMSDTYKSVIHPILIRIGFMWSADKIPTVQEHFISNILRQKILCSIDALPPAISDQNKWLLFLPEDEFHEIGLLYAAYVIRQSGNKVVYLGSSVPVTSVLNAVNDTKPQSVLLFLVRHNFTNEVQDYLSNLQSEFNGQNIYVAGNYKLLSQVELPSNVAWLQDIESLEQIASSN